MSERGNIEQILKMYQTERGGYSRETLAQLGVPWPPPKGWKKKLLGKSTQSKKPSKNTKAGKKPKPKKSKTKYEAFYGSKEWATARYAALKASNGKCSLCGRASADGAVLQVDHIKPLSTHWELRLDPNNHQVLCKTCNWGKGWQDETDWREPDVRKLMGERLS